MLQSSRTFRIFVSSTFSDLKAERSALQEVVFPRLRDLAVAHGCRFQDIDLRWGISEEAALDQQTMKICLSEIARCQRTSPRPNFIILLGNRYGWQPLPYEILVDEFDQILSIVASEEKVQLEQWYRRDDNAIPAMYLLQPRSGIFEDNKTWGEMENNLHQILLTAMKKLSLSPEAKLKYTASATEQEIVKGALQVSDANEHVFCFFREIEEMPSYGCSEDFVDRNPVDSCKQEDLKNHLRKKFPDNIHEYKACWQSGELSKNHLEQFCDDVYNDLSKVILEEIRQLEIVDPLYREIFSHEVFGKERVQVFIGRTEIVETIENYVENNINHPLIIWGESGTGKSALIAKAVERLQVRGQNVICRFIGVTPESTNIRSLLEGLCSQISRKYGVDEAAVPTEYKELIKEFLKCLEHAIIEKPIILFLDAIDQLSKTDGTNNLAWLPVDLPPNVYIIISMLPGESLRNLQNKLPPQNLHELQLMPLEDGQAILSEWFKGINRRLQGNQEQYLLNRFNKCRLPLYLKLLFEEAKLWKSFDSLMDVSEDIPGILRDLFKRLSRQSNHGSMLVSHSLGFLAAAKNGLSEDELLDVLSKDNEVLADFQNRSPKSPKVNHLPVVVWSRLYLDLEPYLMERLSDGISLIGFYHSQMLEACQIAFRDASRHAELAVYFNSQPFYLDKNEQELNLRKLSEMVYQQVEAGFSTQAQETLLDYVYLQARLIGHGVEKLIEDFVPVIEKVVEEKEENSLILLHDALRLSAHVLARDPLQLPSQLSGRLLCFEEIGLRKLLEQMRTEVKHPWLRPLNPCFDAPGGALIHTLDGHTGTICRVLEMPDGQRVISASSDHTLKVWDMERGECLCTLNGHTQFISTLALTLDRQRVVSASADHTLRVWNLENGECLHSLEGHTDIVTDMVLTPDGQRAVSGSRDQTLKVWDLESGCCLRTMEGQKEDIFTIALAPDGHRVAAGSVGIIKIWDIDTGELILTMKGHQDRVTVIEITPDGRKLVSGGGKFDGSLKIWNLDNGECLLTLPSHADYISTLILMLGGKKAISGSHDKTLKLWDLEKGKCILTFTGHSDKVTSSAITLDEQQVVSASWDGTLKVWNLESGQCIQTLRASTMPIDTVVLSSDGKRAISGSWDHSLKVWNLENNTFIEKPCTLAEYRWPLSDIIVTPDGRRMISDGIGEGEFGVKLWDIEKAELIKILNGRVDRIKTIPLTKDGHLAITLIENTLKVWNLEDGKCLHTLLGHTEYISTAVLAPNGRWAISGSKDKTIKVWELESGVCLKTLVGHTDEITVIMLTQDGQRLVSVSADSTLKVWNLENGKCVYTLIGQKNDFHPIVLTSNSQSAVYGSLDHTLKVLNLEGGNYTHILKGHKNSITDIVLTSDGQRAVSASSDCTIKVWELINGKCNHTLVGHTDEVTTLVLTPEGQRGVSGSKDKTLKVWNLENGECLNTSEDLKGDVTNIVLTKDGQWVVSASNRLLEGENQVKIRDLESGRTLASFECEGSCRCVSISTDGLFYGAGDENGHLYFLRLENLTPKAPVVTAWRCKSNSLFRRLETLTFGCPYCNYWSEITKTQLGNELTCPNCGKNLKLNSFAIHGA